MTELGTELEEYLSENDSRGCDKRGVAAESLKSTSSHDYVLTVRFKMPADDDLMAREEANELFQRILRDYDWEAEAKLQEVFKNKEPRKVSL
jgi:HEAT repeat protein